MSSSEETSRVARYFHDHAADFDSIYDERSNSAVRRLRDKLTRGTVVERLQFVKEKAAAWKPATVLDIGCGSGRFSIALATQGAHVTGLDVAEDMLVLGRKYAADAGVSDKCEFLHEDLMTWEWSAPYDLTLGLGLLDYVKDVDPFVGRIAQATAGRSILSFPKLVHPLVPLRAVRLRSSGCPVWFYRRSQVEALGRKHFTSYEVIPFHRDYLLVGTA